MLSDVEERNNSSQRVTRSRNRLRTARGSIPKGIGRRGGRGARGGRGGRGGRGCNRC